MTKYVSHWREHAAKVIARVLKETAGKPEKEIRKALKEAYPFGERVRHPYKVWLSEVAYQLGTKERKKTGNGIVRQPELFADHIADASKMTGASP